MGLGVQPAAFTPVATGSGSGSFAGSLGSVSLASIPKSFWTAAFQVSQTKDLPTAEQYTVTLRLRVTDSGGRVGQDRRTFSAHHDDSLIAGFPLKLSASGESQPALVDLDGTGRLDLVIGTADGQVHAYDPAGGEAPGFPVSTRPVTVLRSEPGVDPGHESILADVAVADLFGNGHQDIVATTMAGTVYAWDDHGRPLPGWPKEVGTGVSKPAIPRPNLPYTRLPIKGALAAPVLADLNGDGRPDVVQAGWDGYIHAWSNAGADLPGWPVKVGFPTPPTNLPSGYHLMSDQKLEATPTLAYFDGKDKPPTLVIRSQYTGIQGPGIQPIAYSYTFAYNANGSLRPGWPAQLPSIIEYYGSAQEFITEGTSSAVAADINNSGRDTVVVTPDFSIPFQLNGSGQTTGFYATVGPGLSQFLEPDAWKNFFGGSRFPDIPASFTTNGAFGKLAGSLKFGQSMSGSISLVLSELGNNTGNGITNSEAVFNANGGGSSFGFPSTRQGLALPVRADLRRRRRLGSGRRDRGGRLVGDARLQRRRVAGVELPEVHHRVERVLPDGGRHPG